MAGGSLAASAAEKAPANGGGDEAEPAWPDAAAEAAFLAGVGEAGDAPAPPPAAAPEALPPVEELLAQIPAELRAALDELFRARFTRVMRAKPKTP